MLSQQTHNLNLCDTTVLFSLYDSGKRRRVESIPNEWTVDSCWTPVRYWWCEGIYIIADNFNPVVEKKNRR